MLRQGVWCRSTLFTLGMGSDIRLRSSPVLWTETSSTPLCRSLRARRTDIRRHAVAKSVVEQRAFSRHASAAARLETSHAVAALEGNDSGPFFASLGDAFSPGPTGTNVGDVAFVLAPGGETVPVAYDPEEEGIPLPDRI